MEHQNMHHTPNHPTPPQTQVDEPTEKKQGFWARFFGALVAVGVFLAFRFLLPSEIAVMVAGGVFAGLLAGLIPYFVGRKRNPALAAGALVVSAIIGGIGGIILALPAAIVMALLLRFAVKTPAEQNQAPYPHPVPPVPQDPMNHPHNARQQEQHGQQTNPGQWLAK